MSRTPQSTSMGMVPQTIQAPTRRPMANRMKIVGMRPGQAGDDRALDVLPAKAQPEQLRHGEGGGEGEQQFQGHGVDARSSGRATRP
jgi:hypothetical protein